MSGVPRRLVQRVKRALLPPPGPRRLPVGIGAGLRLHIDFQDYTRLYVGLYEVELNRHVRRLCRPGVSVFDVGGSIGYDALLFAKLGAAEVVTFESEPLTFERLRANLALNDVGHRVTPQLGQVGSGPSFIELDTVSSDVFGPDLVKIDVDGGEVDVLRGAKHLLSTGQAAFIVETHGRDLEQTCGHLFAEARYRVTIVHQRSVFPDRRPIPHNRWLVAEPRRS